MTILAIFAGMVSAQVAQDLKAKPAWDVTESPCRLMITKGDDDFFLTRLPLQVAERPLSAVKVFASTNEHSSRVVWLDNENAVLLVDASSARKGQLVKIYLVPGDQPLAVGTNETWRDSHPLRMVAQRTAGMDPPATLEQVGMLRTRVDGKAARFNLPGFSALPDTFKEWYRGDWTRKNHLVDLHTWLVVPKSGGYQFGVAGKAAPAWLLVDGREVLMHPPFQPRDSWTSGNLLELSAGLHEITVVTVCRERIDTGLAWKEEGGTGRAVDNDLLTGGDMLSGRWERRDRRLHPFATARSGKAYCFTEVDEVFVPFTLTDGTACWGDTHTAQWYLGERVVGEGRRVEITLPQSTLPAQARLVARASNGEEASFEIELSWRGPVWRQDGVSARVAGLPALLYAEDRINPIVRARCSAPDELRYRIITRIDWIGRESESKEDALTFERGWARIWLGDMAAGALSRLAWSVRHHGIEISCGALRFERAPYNFLPESISGELLKHGEEFVVLLGARTSRAIPQRAAPPARGRSVLLDGFLLGSAPKKTDIISGVERVDLREQERGEAIGGDTGLGTLLPFTTIDSLSGAALVIYAPTFGIHARIDDPESFERRVAAMAGLLTSPVAGIKRVLLVIPPRFDILPGCGCLAGASPCSHARYSRCYAKAVMRVADAHGLETIDLFTAFETCSLGQPLVRDGAVTPAGIGEARRLLLRAISPQAYDGLD